MNALANTIPEAEAVRPAEFVQLELAKLRPSPTNPRKYFDKAQLDELAKNIREQGLHSPILVRPWPTKKLADAGLFEIVAGERRFRAAGLAALTEVLCRVRHLTDVQVLEIQVIENLQRADLTPLEEAGGYQQLMKAGMDVQTVADRVGRSIKYVYDRIKLLDLTKEAQQLLNDGEITAGHAILLARLSAGDQKRAIGDLEDVDEDWRGAGSSPLFRPEKLLFREEDYTGKHGEAPVSRRAISVRELQAWIDGNVKLEAKEADRMLFPELVDTVAAAEDRAEKVVRITYEDVTPEGLKDGPRAILGRSWKRADGKFKSNGCDHSVIGTVVIGAGRGEALRVCVDKKHCTVHWAENVKAAKAREREAEKAPKTGPAEASQAEREAARLAKEKREEAAAKFEDARWQKAEPAILKALAAAVAKAATGPKSPLGQLLTQTVGSVGYNSRHMEAARKAFAHPGDAIALVRFLGYALLVQEVEGEHPDDYAATLKAHGIDVFKIRDEVAPALEPQTKKSAPKAKKASASKKARKK